jgi:uncharacterized protein YehS (DUF1456 family)
VTTTYYLLVKKKHEEGFHSFADMNSSRFDLGLLTPHRSMEKTKKSSQKYCHSSIDKFLEIEHEEEVKGR